MWPFIIFVLIIYALICEQFFPKLGMISAVIAAYALYTIPFSSENKYIHRRMHIWTLPLAVSACVNIYLHKEGGPLLTWPAVTIFLVSYTGILIWGYNTNRRLFFFNIKAIPVGVGAMLLASYLFERPSGSFDTIFKIIGLGVLVGAGWICFHFYKQYKKQEP